MVEDKNVETCSSNNVYMSQSYHLLWVWGIIGVIVFFCQWLAPHLFEGDVMVLLRELVLNQIPNLIGAGLLMTIAVLFDFITPGCTLKAASEEPLPAAILMSALLIALAIIFKSAL